MRCLDNKSPTSPKRGRDDIALTGRLLVAKRLHVKRGLVVALRLPYKPGARLTDTPGGMGALFS